MYSVIERNTSEILKLFDSLEFNPAISKEWKKEEQGETGNSHIRGNV